MVNGDNKPNNIKYLEQDPAGGVAEPASELVKARALVRIASPKLSESFAAWRGGAADGNKSQAFIARTALTLPLLTVSGVQLAPEVDPVRKFLALRKSPRTVQTMIEAFVRIGALYGVPAEDVAWHQLRRLHTDDVLIRLKQAYSARTVNVTLCALRGVLRCAWTAELMSTDDYTRAVGIENLEVQRLPKGRGLGDDEIGHIMAYCRARGPEGCDWPKSAYGSFLLVVVALMLAAGLRASEVSRLTVGSYDRRSRQLRFVGKRDKEAIVPLDDEVIELLEQWLSVRAELDLIEPAPLVVRVRQDGKVGLRTMLLNRRKLEHLCKQIARKALGDKFSPHDLRRTFCTDLLEDGTDLGIAQRLMRHESPVTTALYDRRPLKADAKARGKVKILSRGPSNGGS
jgi:integrase/recombinase XerD